MSITRDNHYVPQWYQKRFLSDNSNKLCYLDLNPKKKRLDDGRVIPMNSYSFKHASQCFSQRDLYTTFFGPFISDAIEHLLFGKIDDMGARAIPVFENDDPSAWHLHFSDFFEYIDSQKIRTPKGLDWIKSHYPKLNQFELMNEMNAIRQMHTKIWSEGVREIVSAENSNVKFIISDHPITVYNPAYSPKDEPCIYPNDPSISFMGTQTIFPLDMNYCLILTNYEYAKNPHTVDPTDKRTNPRNYGNTYARTDNFIKSRQLNEDDVKKINYIIKARARKYIAAPEKEWLYPEKDIKSDWSQLREPLLPQKDELWKYGGEMIIGFEDGSTHYQDAFGRTTPEVPFLKKSIIESDLSPNDPCGCGSGKKYKKCCKNKTVSERSSWNALSIRERNLFFANAIVDILGLSENKTWDDVRKELSNEQVKEIHELYGILWPLETDIISLLPKPDKSLRALYTGIVDPMFLAHIMTNSTLYFDEVIIQNPFTNPHSLKPEFSPIHNPHQYKQQTLNNIVLLFTLLPFIDAGYIHYIPDPNDFDSHLLKQVLSMSKKRSNGYEMDEIDLAQIESLHKDFFERTMSMFTKDQRETYIRQTLPDITDENLEKIHKKYEIKKLQDPLTLLQDDVYGKHGGQLTKVNMSPNFEMSLFISQITGSILLTDNTFRWKEITNSQYKESGMIIYNWESLSTCINNTSYILWANPETTFNLRSSGKLVQMRKVFAKIVSLIQEKEKPSEDDTSIKNLTNEYTKAHNIAAKEFSKENKDSFTCKFNCIIPKGGIVHNNVQRILLTSGSDNYLKSVPMAIFIEYSNH